MRGASTTGLVGATICVMLLLGCPDKKPGPPVRPPTQPGGDQKRCKAFTFEQGKLPRSLPRQLTPAERAPLASIVEDPDNRGKLHRRFRPAVSSQKFIRTLELKPTDVVADIGSGTGALEIGVLEHGVPFKKIYAVDEIGGALVFLDYMLRATRYEGWQKIKTVTSTKEDPRLPAGVLDKALIINVMSFIFDQELYGRKPEKKQVVRFLASLKKTLKPGGLLYSYKEMGDPPPGKARAPTPRTMPGLQVQKSWFRKMGFPLTTAGYEVIQQRAFLAEGVPYLLVVAR